MAPKAFPPVLWAVRALALLPTFGGASDEPRAMRTSRDDTVAAGARVCAHGLLVCHLHAVDFFVHDLLEETDHSFLARALGDVEWRAPGAVDRGRVNFVLHDQITARGSEYLCEDTLRPMRQIQRARACAARGGRTHVTTSRWPR